MAELSEKQIKQRRNAAKKHGVHAFEARGEKTLEPKKVSRLAELRELVKNERGRQEAREELTARMLLIVDLGFSELGKRVNKGEDVWKGGIIARLATYAAESRRLLDSFKPEDEILDISEVITKAVSEHEENT